MQSLNRRRFLGAAVGTGAAAAAAGSWVPTAGAQGGAPGRRRSVPNNRIGIQLYTMREQIPEGDRRAARRVLNFLGSNGYTEVEMAGYWGFTAAQARKWVDDAGLRAVVRPRRVRPRARATPGRRATSRRSRTPTRWARSSPAWRGSRARTRRSTSSSSPNAWTRRARWRRTRASSSSTTTTTSSSSTSSPTGRRTSTSCSNETDPALVKFELDIYWIITGGENPLAYLSADPSRYIGYHVKDRTWKARPDGEQNFEDVGPGSIDFPDVFAAGLGRPRTDKHYFVEHDSPWLSHPNDPEAEFKTALAGVQYLRNVQF